jgi:hypothetical protein
MARRLNNRTGTLAATEASDVAAISGSASAPPPRNVLKFPSNPNVGDTYKHWVWDGEKWNSWAGGDGRPAAAAESAKQLPTTRPKGIGHKCWRVVCEIYALTREGGQWIDLSSLLNTVRERTNDKGLSKRTLNTALSYLRKGGFIDR